MQIPSAFTPSPVPVVSGDGGAEWTRAHMASCIMQIGSIFSQIGGMGAV